MSSERKKPMEEMLEALAKARRAKFGDDPTMPNPMRARLHEEISRSEAAEDENVDSRPSWVTRFWPRLTVAAALATLIVLLPAIWWNQSHPGTASGDLALRDGVARAAAGFNSAMPAKDTLAKAPAVSATEAAVNLADNKQIKIEPAATPASEAQAFTSLTETDVAQGSASSASTSQIRQGSGEIANANTQSVPAAAPALGADSDRIAAAAPPVAQRSSAGDLAMPEQFSQQSAVQWFRNNAQVNRAANVLNTFQVQQEGDEIRVLDADGSTYTGKIESAKSAQTDSSVTVGRDAASRAQGHAARSAGETKSAGPQSYFRATGYNVSLRKTLLFEGNYAAPATQHPARAASNERDRADQSRDRARIVGTVRVNGEAPVPVDAIAETPEATATKKSEK